MFVFTSREKIRQLTSFVSSICPGLDDAGYAACHDIEAKVAEKCEDKETTHGSCNCVAIGRGSVVSDVALQYQSKHEERPHDPLIRRRRGAHSPGSSNCELVTAPIRREPKPVLHEHRPPPRDGAFRAKIAAKCCTIHH